MTLIELRDALMKADRGMRLLDWDISQIVNPMPLRYSPHVPTYSFSLDAAVTLVPTDGFDHPWSWRVGNLASGRAFAFLGTSQKEHVAATPALALCLARLEYEIAKLKEGTDGQ